jgi:hypothetical protein
MRKIIPHDKMAKIPKNALKILITSLKYFKKLVGVTNVVYLD